MSNLRDLTDMLAFEADDARSAGMLGYMARTLVQATMPHRRTTANTFVRVNGNLSLAMMAHPNIGLPYGSIPRLLTAWVTTEAVRTRQRTLVLGDSLSAFMGQLGLASTGGRFGSIPRLKLQMQRLFSTSVSCTYDNGQRTAILNVPIVSQADLWWSPITPGQTSLWRSTITLSEQFFNEVTTSPVPIDMGALRFLKRSPLALDIYCWLTYRMSYLRSPTRPIPWSLLAAQFGGEYQRHRDFKRHFLSQLRRVVAVYPAARVEVTFDGLRLLPGRPHIALARSVQRCG